LLRRALSLTAAPVAHLWPFAYLLFLALSNVAESDLLRHKIFWALYVALAVNLLGGAYAVPADRPSFSSWTATRRGRLTGG
jgi:EamA domain-containing membrane protein RarD